MATEPLTNLWENLHGGEIYCQSHAGAQLRYGIQAKPKARRIQTSFGTYRRMSEADAQAFLAEIGQAGIAINESEICETCRYSNR